MPSTPPAKQGILQVSNSTTMWPSWRSHQLVNVSNTPRKECHITIKQGLASKSKPPPHMHVHRTPTKGPAIQHVHHITWSKIPRVKCPLLIAQCFFSLVGTSPSRAMTSPLCAPNGLVNKPIGVSTSQAYQHSNQGQASTRTKPSMCPWSIAKGLEGMVFS